MRLLGRGRRKPSAPPELAKRTRKPSAFAPAVGSSPPPSAASPSATSTHPAAKQPPTAAATSSSLAPRTAPLKAAGVHFLSGGLAAGFVRASLQPLDTCKTRLQAASLSSSSVPLRRLLLAGGVRGLYRGVVPGVAGIVPAAAVYMLTFQTLRAMLSRRFPRRRNDAVVAVAAGVGDVAASLVRVPCEVLKQRLQVGVYNDAASALRAVGADGGVRRLYSGLGAQLARDVPYAAVEFVVYENLKARTLALRARQRQRDLHNARTGLRRTGEGPAAARLQQRLQDAKLARGEGLLVGALAGAAAAIVSNPADVVKTRLMTQMRATGTATTATAAGITGATALTPAFSSVAVPYRGVRDALVRVAREEGIQAFAKGLAPRIAAKAIQSGMFFAAYEALRRAIGGALGVDPLAARNPKQ